MLLSQLLYPVLPYVMHVRLAAREGLMARIPDEVDFAEAKRASAPFPKFSRSSPIKIRRKFPENWIFISLDSECVAYNYCQVFNSYQWGLVNHNSNSFRRSDHELFERWI
ncbi:hypothetical protein Aduo_001716 [Ancylostoma duodenale]